jgi:hypothetical protein
VKPNSKADIDRRLCATPPSAHEVPQRKCLTSPVEDLDFRERESSNLQLRLDLTA